MHCRDNELIQEFVAGTVVFRCQVSGKAPVVKWQVAENRHSVDHALLWSSGRDYYNTGMVVIDPLFVVDIDDPALVSQFPLSTFTVRTPSGGAHLYFHRTDTHIPATVSVRLWHPKVDTRGGGRGYVLIPPSNIGGIYYEVIDARRPARVTLAELEAIVRALPGGNAVALTSVVDALEGDGFELPPFVPIGQRNALLFQYSASLRARSVPVAEARTLIKHTAFPLVEQSPADAFTLEMCVAVLERVFSSYPAGTHAPSPEPVPSALTPPVGQCNTSDFNPVSVVEAQRSPLYDVVQTIEAALERFVLILSGPSIADLSKTGPQSVMSLAAFRAGYSNARINKRTLADVWLQHPNRLVVDNIGYLPGTSPLPDKLFHTQSGRSCYNCFQPSPLMREPAPSEEPPITDASIQWFLDHVLEFTRDHGEAATRQFLDFLTLSVQQPRTRPQFAVLLVGPPGVAKGWFLKMFMALLGRQNVRTVEASSLDLHGSRFNAWMADSLIVWLDEIKLGGGKYRFAESIKSLITENYHLIDEKYGKQRQSELVWCNFFATTNHLDAAVFGDDDRRWLVLGGDNMPVRSPEYYLDLYDHLRDADDMRGLYRWFLARDISQFNPYARAQVTTLKHAMQDASKSPLEVELEDALLARAAPFESQFVTTRRVLDWVALMRDRSLSSTEEAQIGHIMRRISAPANAKPFYIDGRACRVRVMWEAEVFFALSSVEQRRAVMQILKPTN